MFHIDNYDYDNKYIELGEGGFQEARGRPNGGDV